ncbi:unnamed protein product [Penicillium salamii]|uniref:Uncharacterized protein n=1 Tax=Penicillium salamii TaxID=1612424 RepID=A0A9W4ITU2_9EURO|nr:unnamed protein product [Penicillium salamii]CAG8000104.1 unnamed protein product [Penicillium salamii]CAG8284537.1 unnamed protein product [Penicillium salamii]CAG8325102.1 unnamed protein product [Penicillium salamii]CAG8357684.1 unnamed protein product [Penicillium salamii]
MESSLSTPTDAVLSLQGMGWVTRKALSLAKVTIYIHEYPDSEKPEIFHVDGQSVLTGGIQGTKESRTLDWQQREHTDHIFGKLVGQSRHFADIKSIDIQTSVGNAEDDARVAKFLSGETLVDGSKSEGFLEEEAFMQSFVQNSESGWTAEQIWGFEIIDGQRLHTRRVAVTKNGKVELARLVYSFKAPRTEE